MMMEPAFRDAESWLDQPDYHWMRIVGRLKPGVSEEQARADLAVIHHQILAEDPMKDWSPRQRKDFLSQRLGVASAASGLAFALPKEFSEPLFILMGMVGLVLLIACANVANLLLGRTTVRKKEIAVRLAIGAGRFRVIRQLLTESVMLATAGGALGLLFTYWTSDALVALMSIGRRPLVLDLHPDLGFTGASSLLATILFGLAPALRATRVDLTPALKESTGRLGAKRSRLGLGKALVVSQVAFSLLLLFGAGLLVRTLENLENLDPGFDRKGVLMFDIDATKSGHEGPAATRLYKEVLERIKAIPGVRSASLSVMAPITGGGGWDNSVWVQGYTPRPDENTTVYLNSVSPKYFETLGSPPLLGRDFGPQDTENTPKVAVINQTMARYFFGNSNPIGKKFGPWGQDRNKLQIEVIGVVKDAKYETLREQVPRTAYLDCFQGPPGSMTFEVRTSLKPAAVISQVGNEIRAIDKEIRFGGFKTLEEHVDESLGHERLMATLSSLFGILSMLLACVGLYGVMACAVERRTNEIGIRMALGARQMDVLWMVLRETLLLVLIGVAIGVPSALASARMISSMLYAVRAIDPVTFVGASLFLTSVALVAAYIPARRATKVDPMVALRYE
jgi:predicted permease